MVEQTINRVRQTRSSKVTSRRQAARLRRKRPGSGLVIAMNVGMRKLAEGVLLKKVPRVWRGGLRLI